MTVLQEYRAAQPVNSPAAHCFFSDLEKKNHLKGGYLDFSHLSELKNIYITEIYLKKEYKSSIIKNHKITNKKIFDGVALKGYVAS